MTLAVQERVLRLAAYAAIAALLLMLWSIVSTSPIVLVASMSLGQALGTLSFALYGAVVVFDLRRRAKEPNAGPEAERSEPDEAAKAGRDKRDEAADPEPGDPDAASADVEER